MGRKSATIIITTAAAIAAAVLLFTSQSEPRPGQKKSPPQPAKTTAKENSYARLPLTDPPGTVSSPPGSVASPTTMQTTSTNKEELLVAINEAAITYDPASLPIIAPHLKSPDPEIRAAAADAIIVLGDAAGSSLLRQAAKTARTREEAADLQQKADYLELPPATPEFLKQMRALREQRAAQRQATIPPGQASPQDSKVELPSATQPLPAR